MANNQWVFATLLSLCFSALSFTGYCQETNITSSDLGTNINSPREEEGRLFYDITSESTEGENIFFSFDQFSIGEGEVANFINPDKLSVNNIISRVTGEASVIHGGINSREYGEANFFFINPNGITFGEGATLNVGGSFHASTTDRVVFKDGAVFSADLSSPVTLSSSEPASFGFLDSSVEAIKVENAELKLDSGKVLSLVGGDIEIDGGKLIVTDGQIKIEAQSLLMNNQSLFKSSLEEGDAKEEGGAKSIEKNGIVLNLVDYLELQGGSKITSETSLEAAHSGNIFITIENGEVTISGESIDPFFNINTSSQISSSASNGGVAGDISISSSKLELTDGGTIKAGSSGDSETNKSKAGNITLTADELIIDQGGQILNRTSGNGAGGVVTISTNVINISGENPVIQSETAGSGNAGNIVIRPKENDLIIKGNGTISADSNSYATGNAGNIDIDTAGGDLLITDGINISAKTSSQGLGGSITINGENVDITNGASLTAESLFEQEESLPADSGNSGLGKSGNISVTANERLVIDNSIINLETKGADAGNIVIRAGRLFRMDNQAEITTSVVGKGDGGDIRINEKIDSNIVILSDTSTIKANAHEGTGGNIDIKAYSHIISSDSEIKASAGPAGIDGLVTVTTPDVDATTGILELPESFLDVSALLSNRCAMRTASNSSSFLIGSNSGEASPDDLLESHTSNSDDLAKNTGLEQVATRCW